jgi:tRNA 2-thiouridine synthesizing protein A
MTGDAAPTLEARGLRCPVPIARTRERLATLQAGDRLDVLGDDPFFRLDMQAFCACEGHRYLGEKPEPGGGWRLSLRKGS